MSYLFTSNRLGFRNWKESDYVPFAHMNADKKVTEFFPSALSQSQSDGMVDRMKQHFSTHGFTFYAVEELKSGVFIGFIGIVKPTFDAFFTPCYEIGWRLAAPFWNKGYATEGAKTVLQYAFSTLKMNEIHAITSLPNLKSAHIMKKVGMKKIGEFDHPKLPDGHYLERHVVYAIKHDEFVF